MYIDLLLKKLLHAIKKKKKRYEQNNSAMYFTERYIGITITAQ